MKRAEQRNGDCHPFFVRRSALFLAKVNRENLWLYPFFASLDSQQGLLEQQ